MQGSGDAAPLVLNVRTGGKVVKFMHLSLLLSLKDPCTR